jgi:hypothetical protein
MKRYRRAFASWAAVVALLLPHAAASAQQQQQQSRPAAAKFELTVDSIMRGPDLVGYPPTGVVWSRDGRRVYFRWKRAGEPRQKEQDTYVVGSDGTGLRRLSEEEARRTAPPASGELSKDGRLTVFTEEGDVFLYDHERGERRALTRTSEAESNAHFTRDQRHVYFTRQSNLYVMSLDGGSLEQLTDIRVSAGSGEAPPARAGGGRDSGGASAQGAGASARGASETTSAAKTDAAEAATKIRLMKFIEMIIRTGPRMSIHAAGRRRAARRTCRRRAGLRRPRNERTPVSNSRRRSARASAATRVPCRRACRRGRA